MKKLILSSFNKKSKYGSVRAGNTKAGAFDSLLEENCFLFLSNLQASGMISYFLRQVPFHLIGGLKYKVDFLLFLHDGRHIFIDIKGFKTRAFIDKKKIVEASFPVEIVVLYKHDYKQKIFELLKEWHGTN